jgi:hypothetical protein
MRFNHMELTLPRGTLTDDTRADIDAFYGEVFGWKGKPTEVVGQLCHLLLMDDGLFLLLAESDKPMTSPGYDHLGVLLDSPEEVDEVRERCKRYQEKDDRVRIKEYDDLVTPTVVCHAFYVRHLLPIWFDVQSLTPTA